MESKINYTTVGLIVLILFAGFISAILWLSVGFDKKLYNTYAVYIPESVTGLNEDAVVKYNGVKVGYVNKIRLNKNDPRQVQLLLNIEAGTPITVSTYATLISQGITGVSYVGLAASSASLEPLEKTPGEMYPIIPAKLSLFSQLDKTLKEVSVNVNRVILRMDSVFDEENLNNFKGTLTNLRSFSDVISKNSQNINTSLESVAKVSNKLITSVDKFNSMAVEINDAGRVGKNTINQIGQDVLPSTMTLLRRLNNIAANLEELSVTLKQNPSVLIRGIKPPPPGPGE